MAQPLLLQTPAAMQALGVQLQITVIQVSSMSVQARYRKSKAMYQQRRRLDAQAEPYLLRVLHHLLIQTATLRLILKPQEMQAAALERLVAAIAKQFLFNRHPISKITPKT